MKAAIFLLQIIIFMAIVLSIVNANSTVLYDFKKEHAGVLDHVKATRMVQEDRSHSEALHALEHRIETAGASIIQSHMFPSRRKCKDAVTKVVAEYKRRGVPPQYILQPMSAADDEDMHVFINISGPADINLTCQNGVGTKTAYVQFTQ